MNIFKDERCTRKFAEKITGVAIRVIIQEKPGSIYLLPIKAIIGFLIVV